MTPLLYVVFFLSGISGLIYQVVWVREFGHAFGNTLHSASLVVAIFMLGLGVGSYIVGAWADRRYHQSPDSLLRAYAYVEGLIAALGLTISLVLPHLGALVAGVSAYAAGADGWYSLTVGSYVARAALAVVLLTPITMLMGGTLTLLIRFLVRADLRASGWMVAALYTVNTVGASAGAFLTDFALIPELGLRATQLVAVALNAIAAVGALLLTRRQPASDRVASPAAARRPARQVAVERNPVAGERPVVGAAAATLALSGFAAMGMEILWLRHFTLVLGGFRAVFSLLLAVMLLALAAGALLGGWLDRRYGRPAQTLMFVEALFVAAVLAGLAVTDAGSIGARANALAGAFAAMSGSSRALTEFWYNTRPILLEVTLPALLTGCAFPLGNAIVQRAEDAVGRRAGLLYLANTAGAVCGSLVAGYVLLPALGIQGGAAVLALVATAAICPLYLATRRRPALVAALAIAAASVMAWVALPADFLLQRTLLPQSPGERVLALSEGSTELIAVVEAPGRGRGLLTNGHAMSSTALLDQRYMRALAHIPLLSMNDPRSVLVIGFGVGNTTHAASLHPTVQRIDVADLSRHVLEQAEYFRDANHDVLRDPRVSVYLNDGRQHLQMVQPGTYDLITLEPPPVAYAGVSALYSREFYALARSRLKPGGFVSQWLPAYQVPAESSLAMVRAFVDAFPHSVLLSGTLPELLLIGTNADRIEADPARLEAALRRAPAARADLERVNLDRPRDIIAAFIGSSTTMQQATRESPAATDDRPLQEYGVRSVLGSAATGVPAALFDLAAVTEWCPTCTAGEGAPPELANLDLQMRLLEQAYLLSAGNMPLLSASAGLGPPLDSGYLAAVVPDSAEARHVLAIAHLRAGRRPEAIRELEAALARDASLSAARRTLGELRYEDGETLLERGQLADATAQFRAAVDLMPDSAPAHNNLGVALASAGAIQEAATHFAEAVRLQPDFAQARENLAATQKVAR